MKAIANHLGQIIAVLAAIAVLIAAVVVFRAPIGGFFNSITEKQTAVGGDLLDNIDVSDLGNLTSGGNGGDGGSGSGGSEELVVEGTVPVGATYYVAATDTTLLEGAALPATPQINDIFETNDYKYTLTSVIPEVSPTMIEDAVFPSLEEAREYVRDNSETLFGASWETLLAEVPEDEVWAALELTEETFVPGSTVCGWEVSVKDKTKTAYADIYGAIGLYPTVSLSNTFYQCTQMTSAPKIPSSVVTMYRTFRGCYSLESVPDMSDATNVINMAECFTDCYELKVVSSFPPNIQFINLTFSGCRSLESVPTIPTSVKYMQSTFAGCSALVVPPDMSQAVNVKDIRYAFSACTALSETPNYSGATNLENMGSAFYGCSSLTSAAAIPATVTQLESAFKGCGALESAPDMSAIRDVSDIIFLSRMFEGCSSLSGTITINFNVSGGHHGFFLANTVLPITITGSASDETKAALAATSSKGNVTWE